MICHENDNWLKCVLIMHLWCYKCVLCTCDTNTMLVIVFCTKCREWILNVTLC